MAESSGGGGKGDIALTFDPTLIMRGVNMAKNAVKGLYGAFQGVVGFMNKMVPEVGQSMDIAGEIIIKNLFWPLKQQVIPILQKMLNWVRDHRTLFVQWGQVIANVFRVLKVGFDVIVRVVKQFAESFMKNIKGALKLGTSDLISFVNLLLFKIATVFIYLQSILMPLMEPLGELIAKVAISFQQLAQGFADGFGKSFDVTWLNSLVEQLSALFDLFTGSKKEGADASTSFMSDLGKGLGILLGYVSSGIIEFLSRYIGLLTELLSLDFAKSGQGFKYYFQELALAMDSGKRKSSYEAINKRYDAIINEYKKKGMTAQAEEFDKRTTKNWNKYHSLYAYQDEIEGDEEKLGIKADHINDGAILKDGKVIKFADDDNIFASKKMPGAGAGGGNFIFNVNMNVTEGNARVAGSEFAVGLDQKLRMLLLKDYGLQGGR